MGQNGEPIVPFLFFFSPLLLPLSRAHVVGTGLRNRRKKTTSPVPMRREEQRRNRKVKGMFWASLHFSSKGHFFSHKLASFPPPIIHRELVEVSLGLWEVSSFSSLSLSHRPFFS